jgi:hypothetical protein
VVVAVGLTVLLEPAPKLLSHANVPVPLAVKLTFAPLNILSSLLVHELSVAVIAVLGALTIVMVLLAVAVQPFASVIVTLYVVVTEGLTVLLEPAPKLLSHANVPVPLAVKFTLAPLNILSSFDVHELSVAVIAVLGAVTIVMVLLAVAAQPFASVIVTL